MFIVIDLDTLSDNPTLIAYHTDKRVADHYAYMMNSEYNHNYMVKKIKNKVFNTLYKNVEDLYLVRYGDNYVQVKYIDYIELVTDQVIYDDTYAKDILLKMLETRQLSKREKKIFEKAILLLEDIIHDEESYIPDERELNGIKTYYDALSDNPNGFHYYEA